jgi:DNA-binding NtrC family response regulator
LGRSSPFTRGKRNSGFDHYLHARRGIHEYQLPLKLNPHHQPFCEGKMLERAILFALDTNPDATVVERTVLKCGVGAVLARSETELLGLLVRFSPECLVILCGGAHEDQTLLLAAKIRQQDHHCSVLACMKCISTQFAIRAMKEGISDLLDSGATTPQLEQAVNSFVAQHKGCKQLSLFDGTPAACRTLVGVSPAMTRVRYQVARAAAADANVLITGESGTGKELVAQSIHEQSHRRRSPFVALNCAALPDTLLESELFGYERGAFTGANAGHEGRLQHAAGGTMFLDEIGEMSLLAQAKILRAVDTRVIQRLGSNRDTQVQVRLIAATNQDVEHLVEENKFRQDLYYRLNVVRLKLPPLRDRLEDIPELIDHILRDLCMQQRVRLRIVEEDMIRRLQDYDWPGNIRELRNVLESMLVFSSSASIGSRDLPVEITRKLRSNGPFVSERAKIISALDSAHWNRNGAAGILACSRMTLFRKMSKYGILTANKKMDQAS